MDTFTKAVRSQIMRAVKSRGNKSTELALINVFKKYSLKGWRRNSDIFGHPDFYFPRMKIAVFADGCFWHGCKCKKNKPKANSAYWQNKIRKNKIRDRLVNQHLKKHGYMVVRIRECQIKKGKLTKKLLDLF